MWAQPESNSELCEKVHVRCCSVFFVVVEWKRKLLTPYRKPDRSTGLIVSHTFMLYGDVGCVVCCVVLANSLKETRKKDSTEWWRAWKMAAAGTRDFIEYGRIEERRKISSDVTIDEQRTTTTTSNCRALSAVPTQGYPRTIEREPLRCYYCCCATIIISRLFFPSHHRRSSSSWRWNMLKCFHDDFEDFLFTFSSSSRVVRVFCLNNSLSLFKLPIHRQPTSFWWSSTHHHSRTWREAKASNDIQARTR